MNDVWLAIGLTTFAGLATGIGSVIAFGAKRSNYRFLAVATGFSAGVMLYVSFVELFPQGASALEETYGKTWGMTLNVLAFFGGIALMAVIDFLIPSAENPHETHAEIELASLRGPAASAAGAVATGPVTPGPAADTVESGARGGCGRPDRRTWLGARDTPARDPRPGRPHEDGAVHRAGHRHP